tara:strand:+ start:352 stop:576 length:225 start_codon:yes stop_codon:yes gene_type:complete
MPKHYGGDKKEADKKGGKSKAKGRKMANMTDAQHKKFLKAEKDGLITKKQHQNLSAGLLEGIIKKKQKSGKGKK